MQLFFCGEDAEAQLQSELKETFGETQVQRVGPLLFRTDFSIPVNARLPYLPFARQWLPNAEALRANSIREWADALFSATVGRLVNDRPWRLHLAAHYGAQVVHRIGARTWHTTRRLKHRASSQAGFPTGIAAARAHTVNPEAGRHRCRLIRESVLELLHDRRRSLRRNLQEETTIFTANDSLVQLWLTGPGTGFFSIACAPLPFEQRHLLSPFPKGEALVATDKAAPSRAFAKLIEAELRSGTAIRAGETCVDLGAAPGSWTYVAIKRGASVHAVDRSPLRPDLMVTPNVKFDPSDAFRFKPQRPVDWLLCDVIATAERTAELLLNWLRQRWCRRFVVTLKMQQTTTRGVLPLLKRELPHLTSAFYLQHLNANKNEVCAFGTTD
ncbi:MAG TPA: SAM-dependent methyltransferase [Candidatus Limnocylindrales bacterium]|jgi:23S rRNA (cytidine2498-2'-O)-methyltransferase|nr:SAM-dependent methyltransferase [Candidatus Limnocylindrales bacterium]